MDQVPLQNLPIGEQDFPLLREGGFLYVDKTEYLHRLITTGKVYFISRPRRFGKSLMISTLEAIFKGRKELFDGLWIKEQSDYDWAENPVIRLDMSSVDRGSPDQFKLSMQERLQKIAQQYSVEIQRELSPASMLNQLLEALSEQYTQVVALVDEYDKPIIDNMKDPELADAMRKELRAFYTILKAQSGNLRFVMLTGVTKFSKTSIFSGLNNPDDLTLENPYVAMLGYTQSELESYFSLYIKRIAETQGKTIQEALQDIKHWYNGYQFSSKGEKVYNPFSTLRLMKYQEFRPFWFETGTTNFLLDMIDQSNRDPEEIAGMEVSALGLQSQDIDQLSLAGIFFQTGYITIVGHDNETRLYRLDYPNQEVRESLSRIRQGNCNDRPEFQYAKAQCR